MMAHTIIPALGKPRREALQFKASLGYIAKLSHTYTHIHTHTHTQRERKRESALERNPPCFTVHNQY
jgi:hypothetical protein